MNTFRCTSETGAAATIDHMTGRTSVGAPSAPYRRVARPAAKPNYGARRLGAAGIIVVGLFVAAQAVGAAAAFFGSNPVLAAADGEAGDRAASSFSLDTHVARDGDSLWSIAEAYRGGTDRESYIDALVELNGGAAIQVGQAVLLPRS